MIDGIFTVIAVVSFGIRLDAESRVERLTDALRKHQADPESNAESVQPLREQAIPVLTR